MRVKIEDATEAENYLSRLKEIFNFVEICDNSILIKTENCKKVFYDVNRWFLENKIDFNAIEIIQPSLEDIFINFTERNDDIVECC